MNDVTHFCNCVTTSSISAHNDVLLQGNSYGFYNDPPFTVVNNTMYFWGYTAVTGWELFKYNPSIVASIELVKNISSGTESTTFDYYEMRNVNDTLYFRVINSKDGSNELWMSKGKAFNTQKVKSFLPGEYFYNLFDGYGTVYFSKYDATYGYELWKSDGTDAGTVLVKDIYAGQAGSSPSYLTDCNGRIFFAAAKANKGRELWLTNGSEAGTTQVKDINKTTTSGSYAGNYANMSPLANGVVFSAFEIEHGNELYKSDGTSGGTTLVDDIFSGASGSNPYNFLAKNNEVYFTANTLTGPAIYKTNGSAGGTKKVTGDIDFNTYYGYISNYDVADNGLVFYVLYNFPTNVYDLWRSDGTTTGTYLLASNLYYSNSLATAGNKAFFVAGDDINGYELWKSNGTVAGTKLVKDIYPGSYGSYPYCLFAYNNEIYFGANDGTGYYNSFWKSDGTAIGTVKLANIEPQLTYNNYGIGDYFCISNNILYLNANDYYVTGNELWRTDGTSAGTRQVKDINPYYGSSPNYLTDVNGILCFTADDGVHGNELWRSNGTAAGTKLVKDITPGADWSNLSNLCSAGGKLYFLKDIYSNTETLWSSNGTESGTKQVADAGLKDVSSMVTLVGVGNKLFFNAYSYQYGSELWEGDASAAEFAATTVKDASATINTTFNATLYPNPTHNTAALQITGNTKDITVTITDIAGHAVWQRKFNEQTQINLPSEKLRASTYIVTVKSGTEIKTIKLVKE